MNKTTTALTDLISVIDRLISSTDGLTDLDEQKGQKDACEAIKSVSIGLLQKEREDIIDAYNRGYVAGCENKGFDTSDFNNNYTQYKTTENE